MFKIVSFFAVLLMDMACVLLMVFCTPHNDFATLTLGGVIAVLTLVLIGMLEALWNASDDSVDEDDGENGAISADSDPE